MKLTLKVLLHLYFLALLSGCALDALLSSGGSRFSTDSSSTTDFVGVVSTVATAAATNIQNGSSVGYLAADANGNIYSGDIFTNLIKKVTPDGIVSTFADTTPTGAAPYGLAMGADGFLYVFLSDGTIAKISSGGVITTVASGASTSFANDSNIGNITVDANNNVYASDQHNHSIKKIAPNGVVTVFADVTSIDCTNGIAFGLDGNLYGAACGGEIVKILPNGTIQIIADAMTANLSNDSGYGYITVDSANNVYASDNYHHVIKKIAPDGTVTVFAGSGSDDGSGTDGPALSAPLTPYGLAFSSSGNATINFFDSSGSLRRVR